MSSDLEKETGTDTSSNVLTIIGSVTQQQNMMNGLYQLLSQGKVSIGILSEYECSI
jgi:hypothetical protein